MEVSEIMTPNPEIVLAGDSVRTALNKLLENDIRHLPVLRGEKLVGMISDRDLRGVASLSEEEGLNNLADKPVAQLMSSGVVTVSASDDVKDLIEILLEGKFGAVPVVDPHDKRLVGIVSYIDVLEALRTLLS